MSKELENFKIIESTIIEGFIVGGGFVPKHIKEALKTIQNRLEAIDNANPSEAIKNLEKIKKYISDKNMYEDLKLFDGEEESNMYYNGIGIINQALIKADLDKRIAEEYDKVIKKQEKVLDILFEKPLSLFALKMFKKYGKNEVLELEYQSFVDGYKIMIEDFDEDMKEQIATKEEFDTLKKYLERISLDKKLKEVIENE